EHQRTHAIERRAQDRGQHRLLVREVLVERAAADAGGRADVADVGSVIAALGEHALRARQDLALTRLGPHITHGYYSELTCQFYRGRHVRSSRILAPCRSSSRAVESSE